MKNDRRRLVWPWTEAWSWITALVLLVAVNIPLLTLKSGRCVDGISGSSCTVQHQLLGSPGTEIFFWVSVVLALGLVLGLVVSLRQRPRHQ